MDLFAIICAGTTGASKVFRVSCSDLFATFRDETNFIIFFWLSTLTFEESWSLLSFEAGMEGSVTSIEESKSLPSLVLLRLLKLILLEGEPKPRLLLLRFSSKQFELYGYDF
jgi:hypothetical protein